MTTESSGKIEGDYEYYYDREAELKAFEDSKAGVKGLVDGGVEKIPRIFVHNQSDINGKSNPGDCKFSIPVVDLEGIYRDANLRAKIVGQVRDACEKWGFFQLVNHGIPASVLEDMMDGVRRFHEQDIEVKKEFYSRDETRKFKFNTNFDFFQASASNWRDSLYCVMAPQPPHPEELPEICRYVC
uniref:Non-haem dioxygenase N-terminal domain-containing protein n=1 Tax=Rhizophora mucronata TaxID=61149 RepID=A0A2P2JYD7_RHIMU